MRRLLWIPCAFVLFGCPADGVEDEEEGSSEPMTGSDDSSALGCAADIEHDTTDGAMGNLQEAWGSACEEDADCVAVLGAGAVCLTEAVIYALPLGYCSKPCTLGPDDRVIVDDETCQVGGGIDCIGNNAANFQYCAPPCTDDGQCGRDGYTCRLMPMIAMEGDPTYCLMPDCCDFLSCTD